MKSNRRECCLDLFMKRQNLMLKTSAQSAAPCEFEAGYLSIVAGVSRKITYLAQTHFRVSSQIESRFSTKAFRKVVAKFRLSGSTRHLAPRQTLFREIV